MSARTQLGYPEYIDPGIDCKKTLITDEEVAKAAGIKLKQIKGPGEKPGYEPKIIDTINLTEQHHATEMDLNNIVARYKPEELMASAQATDAVLGGDYTRFQNLQEAVIIMENAKNQFMELPPEIRSNFDNNPGNLVKAFDQMQSGDKTAWKRLSDLGLVTPEQVTPPVVENPQKA